MARAYLRGRNRYVRLRTTYRRAPSKLPGEQRPTPDGHRADRGDLGGAGSALRRVLRHDRTTATTYINDNVVVCILEDILSTSKSDSPQDEVLARSERDALLASLSELPEAQAEVIVLAFYGELSHSEIAVQLDLPAGTIKGRMRLGLEKLRREMDAPGKPDFGEV